MGVLLSIREFLFPRFCLTCGRRLEMTEHTICSHCNIGLPRTYLWKDPEDNVLAKRYWGRADVVKAAAYIRFVARGTAADIVYDFKYHHNKKAAREMGRMMAQEIEPSGFLDGIDCIVPVPLTFLRLFRRGYNQSTELAKGIGDVTGIPVVTDALKRTRFKTSQTRLTREERIKNTENAFTLGKNATALEGRHVLLVDDVITTGATTTGCARQIKQIRGTTVSVLSLGCVM